MARSLNKVELIGNLTRDPELRYTPQGTAVCNFGLATNRQWTTEAGEKKEDTEFHRIVAWNKLAELCSQLLSKGRKVFVQGRLQTRRWTAQDGNERTTTEIVISDMIILDSRAAASDAPAGFDIPEDKPESADGETMDVTDVGPKKPVKEREEKKSKKGAKVKVSQKVAKGASAKKSTKVKKGKTSKKSSKKQDRGEDIPF